ncbi:hypothetical protein TNCV_2190441 [Trichonephila clavipes]|uniref:Uncharacterized protein n=1 Tax=Trichonephila clavipes TaxID=2585209 RepID=A0A8X6UY01_TRICX|nr:hypothetical protein TNCV_2190441 [Trichonephila clavipes]
MGKGQKRCTTSAENRKTRYSLQDKRMSSTVIRSYLRDAGVSLRRRLADARLKGRVPLKNLISIYGSAKKDYSGQRNALSRQMISGHELHGGMKLRYRYLVVIAKSMGNVTLAIIKCKQTMCVLQSASRTRVRRLTEQYKHDFLLSIQPVEINTKEQRSLDCYAFGSDGLRD